MLIWAINFGQTHWFSDLSGLESDFMASSWSWTASFFVTAGLVAACLVGIAVDASRAFYVFGDSLVDNGNNNFLVTPARADSPPYGIDYPTHMPTGRFSNGLNIPDIISEQRTNSLNLHAVVSWLINLTGDACHAYFRWAHRGWVDFAVLKSWTHRITTSQWCQLRIGRSWDTEWHWSSIRRCTGLINIWMMIDN